MAFSIKLRRDVPLYERIAREARFLSRMKIEILPAGTAFSFDSVLIAHFMQLDKLALEGENRLVLIEDVSGEAKEIASGFQRLYAQYAVNKSSPDTKADLRKLWETLAPMIYLYMGPRQVTTPKTIFVPRLKFTL